MLSLPHEMRFQHFEIYKLVTLLFQNFQTPNGHLLTDLFIFGKCFVLTMSISLNTIVISNFKSFKKEIIIGPIRPFMAIIGPNGSGEILMLPTTFILFDLEQSYFSAYLNSLFLFFYFYIINNYIH